MHYRGRRINTSCTCLESHVVCNLVAYLVCQLAVNSAGLLAVNPPGHLESYLAGYFGGHLLLHHEIGSSGLHALSRNQVSTINGVFFSSLFLHALLFSQKGLT